MILPPYRQNVVIVIYVANNAPVLFPSFPITPCSSLHDTSLTLGEKIGNLRLGCVHFLHKFQSVQLKASSSPDVAQPALQIAPTPPQFVPGSVLLAVNVPEGR